MGAGSKAKPRSGSKKGADGAAPAPKGGLDALSEAIESGAGLPAVVRAAAGALGANIALIDRSSAVLAVAAGSGAEEEKLLGLDAGVETVELRVADAVVGELRYRPRSGETSSIGALRMVATMLGLEVERARGPEWASDDAARDFVRGVLSRRLVGDPEIAAQASELGTDLEAGAGVVIARAAPGSAQTGDWRARVLTLVLRAVRSNSSGALAATLEDESAHGEVALILPASDGDGIERAARAVEEELRSSLPGFAVTVGFSRHSPDPSHVYRAGKEALMAVNVAEAEDRTLLAFEETGSYRLLLPAMSEDPAELERFFDETVAPLAAYDDQYETELVATVEAYLDNDGNVTPTAETLFTHRHTVRYRLERVRELCGHDLSSTEGREKLGLGLKAMRVLGIAAPGGPALEGRSRASRAKRSE
ncbi:MAG: helix-turn-helix domain-containing protein [Solirubrobacterales bacterium]|nr:helix-turn-helix domain-containing protein [Solirubrobacterales bacterium]MCB8970893.1 helix-turn-helix domain-containing protein [Thermoleophilales bacterium]MCO5326211.1 helix-turn-helix domain-containing protein [Solirubrobacterales bacterium]